MQNISSAQAQFQQLYNWSQSYTCAMARKRDYEEMEKFDDVDRATSSASVYGVVTSLSLVKKSHKTNYFEGTVSDKTSKLRLVGFDTKSRWMII